MSHYIITNAGLAVGAAVLVLACSHFIRNDAIKHFLWVVVLIRFIAPPLFEVPVGIPQQAVNDVESKIAQSMTLKGSTERSDVEVGLPRIQKPDRKPMHLLGIIWAVGAIAIVSMSARRAIRLNQLLRNCEGTHEGLQGKIEQICQEMGVRRVPDAHLVSARISPMVWAWSRRPVMLLPRALWKSLTEDEQTAVLKHELAHLVRRDHYVRVVEALATATHWWCPVLWWVRRQLHKHEERSCDAWAMSSDGVSNAALASACLRTVEFLGGNDPRRQFFGATFMAGFKPLRTRLELILKGEKPDANLRRLNPAIMMFAVLAIGFSPTFTAADEEPLQAFDGIRIVGTIDVIVRSGQGYKVAFGDPTVPRPQIEIDKEKRRVLVALAGPQEGRPKLEITAPSLAFVEASNGASVRLENLECASLLIGVTRSSRVSASGTCESLTVTAEDLSQVSGNGLTADSVVVSARNHSAIVLGKAQVVIQSSDATSEITLSHKDATRGL